MSKPATYVELVLLAEIEKALKACDRDVLVALDRVQEASSLRQDPRVARQLQIAALTIEVRARLKGAA